MPLTTASNIKATWLNIADTTHDTKLTALIAQAGGIIKGICKQPIDSESVEVQFAGNGSQTYLMPYTVPVVLSTLKYKANIDDAAWTTVTGAVVVKAEGVWTLFYEDGFTYPLWQATVTVGYDGVTHAVPQDVRNVCEEMTVELFKMTDYAGRDSRFGVGRLATGESGMTQTTVYRDLQSRYRARLSPYVLRAWL